MNVTECYKALSYDLLIYGFKPVDLVLAFVGFVMIHGIFNSLMVDFIYGLVALIVARSVRNRPPHFFKSLVNFLVTPDNLQVQYEDSLKPYVLKKGS